MLLRSYMVQMTQNAPFSLSLSLSLSHCACICVVVVTLTMYTHTQESALGMLAGALSLSFGFYWLMKQTTPAQMHVRLHSYRTAPRTPRHACVCVENGDISSRDNDALLMLKYVCLYALHMYTNTNRRPRSFPSVALPHRRVDISMRTRSCTSQHHGDCTRRGWLWCAECRSKCVVTRSCSQRKTCDWKWKKRVRRHDVTTTTVLMTMNSFIHTHTYIIINEH